jgi:hypothetical protein
MLVARAGHGRALPRPGAANPARRWGRAAPATGVQGHRDTGVDIFFREVQGEWDELYPFVDGRAAESAARLGLPRDGGKLADLVPRKDFTRLVAALVRAGLAGAYDELTD